MADRDRISSCFDSDSAGESDRAGLSEARAASGGRPARFNLQARLDRLGDTDSLALSGRVTPGHRVDTESSEVRRVGLH